MAEVIVTVNVGTGAARYVFDDEKKARDLLDAMLDTCDNMEQVIHSIFESSYVTTKSPDAQK